MVEVINGVNTLNSELEGQTVAQVREALRQPLNIDPEATVKVNGKTATATRRLSDGDTVEFIKASGRKGL